MDRFLNTLHAMEAEHKQNYRYDNLEEHRSSYQ